jgi:MoaA/NifB/PqqE/SkfB family radical SAM enzyme
MKNLFSPKPKIMIFFITYSCNSRCIMCYIWQKQSKYKELSLAKIDNLFCDKLLSQSLERINLTGGEPTLYPYLLDAVKVFVNRCPNLKSIDMPTNGFDTGTVLEKVETMLAALFNTNIKLFVTVSIDGIGETAEKVRNVPEAFEKINMTIDNLIELNKLYKTRLSVNLNTTVSKVNFDKLEELRGYAFEKKIGINFTPAAISEIGVESIQKQEEFLMGREEKEKVAKFFEKLMKNSEISHAYSKFVINWLTGSRRKSRCIFKQKSAFLLEPSGDVYLCGNFKDFWLGNIQKSEFLELWRNISAIKVKSWNKCNYCVSNCYIDELK